MELFKEIPDKIFERAGISKVGNEDRYKECMGILSQSMAFASVNYGLSDRRVDYFNAQKDALVNDLKELKEKGEIV